MAACGLPDRCVPNMLLALLWASQVQALLGWQAVGRRHSGCTVLAPSRCHTSIPRCLCPSMLPPHQANAVPTLTWVLGFLLLPENGRHRTAVVDEAAAAVAAASGDSDGAASDPATAADGGAEALPRPGDLAGLVALAGERRSAVAAAIDETLRLRCFSVDVRIAAADGVLPCGGGGSGSEDSGPVGIWVQKVRPGGGLPPCAHAACPAPPGALPHRAPTSSPPAKTASPPLPRRATLWPFHPMSRI